MNKTSRTFLFIGLLVVFFIISPAIILYSQGYRLNVQNWQILKTGGIYIKTSVPGADIYIDNKFTSKTGQLFSFDYLAQNLFPQKHNIKVEKSGFVTWQKNLNVNEKMVTQAYVILFPDKIDLTEFSLNISQLYPFGAQGKIILADSKNRLALSEAGQSVMLLDSAAKDLSSISDIVMSPDGNRIIIRATEKKTAKIKYYLLQTSSETTSLVALKNLDKNVSHIEFYSNNVIFAETSGKLYREALDTQKQTLITQKLVEGFALNGDNLYFLQDGALLRQNTITNITETVLEDAIEENLSNSYSLFYYWDKLFVLKNKNTLYVYNDLQKSLDLLIVSESEIKNIGFGDKMLFYNDSRLWLYLFRDYESPFFSKADSLLVLSDYNKINGLDWIGGEYFAIIDQNNNVNISEIDNRDKINSFKVSNDNVSQIWFDQKDKKLYLLSNDKVLVSPKLIP
jgi:hypothetical protein